MASANPKRMTWRERFETTREPRVVGDPRGRGSMLISTPREIDAVMRGVRKGKAVTVAQLMRKLADDHGTDATCPPTTGIFLRVVAEVAEEDLEAGRTRLTPYWRVVKAGGSLNPKFPGGVELQAARLKEGGHAIKRGSDGRPRQVVDYRRHRQEIWRAKGRG